MIMKRTKAALFGFVAAIALCFGCAGTAWADVAESEIFFSQSGSGVDVSLDGKGPDVSAFSLVMDVDVSADAEDAVDVGFQFSDFIKDNCSMPPQATFKPVGDKTRITLYVAGGHDLFANPPISVGRITLGLDTELSSGAEATVTVPEETDDLDAVEGGVAPNPDAAYALRTVTSAHAEDKGAVFLAEPFTAYLGDRMTTVDPPIPSDPDDLDDDSDDEEMSPDDGKGPKGPDPSQRPVGGDLSKTGDNQMVVLGTLLAVVAVALCTLGIVVIMRKRRSKQ